MIIIPYSTKFSRVFNFMNFTNFLPFTKLFQRKVFTCKLQFSRARVLMEYIPWLCCQICKERFPKRYLRNRHCFADRCELECRRQSGQCILDTTCLYAMPILHYVAVCTWVRQRIHKFISMKFSKTFICENLDPRKLSALRYYATLHT